MPGDALRTRLPLDAFEATYLEANGVLPIELLEGKLRVAADGIPDVTVLDELERFARALGVQVQDLTSASGPTRRESTRYSLPSPRQPSDTTDPEDVRPGHVSPSLAERPRMSSLTRVAAVGAQPARARRPTRIPTQRDGGRR